MNESIVVGIVGRPNVGKSTLFNILINKGISVVSDIEGTTRDVLVKSHNYHNRRFIFIDSGGIVSQNSEIDQKVRQKVEEVLFNSDVILFVVDNISGLAPLDLDLADIIRKSGLKNRTILVLNKSESLSTKEEEFKNLGFHNTVQISCKTKMNINELVFMIMDVFDKEGEVNSIYRNYSESGKKVSFVGRPNVGKSSLVNAVLQSERVIVSSIPNTTRDSVDVPFTFENHEFVLIDTPGVRRKSFVDSKLEAYSITRSIGSIKYSDIVCLVLDIYEGLTRQDKRLVYQVFKYEKPAVIVANKFDLVIEEYKKKLGSKFNNRVVEDLKYELAESIKSQLYLIPYAPVVFVSAKTKYQVDSVMYSIVAIKEQLDKNLSSLDLKDLLNSITLSLPLVEENGKRLRFKIKDVKYYKESIPTLKVYTNLKRVPDNFRSYLKNTLGRVLNIPNVPIKILFVSN